MLCNRRQFQKHQYSILNVTFGFFQALVRSDNSYVSLQNNDLH